MNQAETLCHSSGPWKKHKYISKVGEGAKAVYKYAKSSAENPEGVIENTAHEAKKFYRKHVTGDEYKGREWAAKENSAYDKHLAENAVKEGRMEAANRAIKSSERYGKKAAQAEHDYRTKSLKGITESAISRGQKKIDEILHPKTTITITSNLMKPGTKKVIKK